jgi:hypothetical protein
VSLVKHTVTDENGDDIDVYGATIDLELENGKDKHFLSLATHIADPCPHCAAREAVFSASSLSDEYFIGISVFDAETGDELELDDDRVNVEYLLEEIAGAHNEDAMDFVEPTNKVLH